MGEFGMCFKSILNNVLAVKMLHLEMLSRLGEDVTLWIAIRVHTVWKKMK